MYKKKILNLFIINYSRKRITYAQQMDKNERKMYNSYWKHLFSYEICLHFSCSDSSGCHMAIDWVSCIESMSSCRSMSFLLEAFWKSFLYSVYCAPCNRRDEMTEQQILWFCYGRSGNQNRLASKWLSINFIGFTTALK